MVHHANVPRNEVKAYNAIREHALKQANAKVHGAYSTHQYDDPAVQKLADQYMSEVRRDIYGRAKSYDYRSPTTTRGGFRVTGDSDDPQLRLAHKPMKLEIPDSWRTRSPSAGEGYVDVAPQKLGL